jgi:hypothetical protein
MVQCNVSSVPVPALAIHLSGRLRGRAPAPSLTLRRTSASGTAESEISISRRRRYKPGAMLGFATAARSRRMPAGGLVLWSCHGCPCRNAIRARVPAEDRHDAESSATGPEPEDLPPQPLGSPRWTCSLCRRSVSGSSTRSLILHHDVDANYQWRSHPIRRPNGLHGRSRKPFPGKRHRNTCFATARPSMGMSSGNSSPPWASATAIGPLPLGRLWRDQGKRTEARDLLAPIYGWFTEVLRHAGPQGEGTARGVDKGACCIVPLSAATTNAIYRLLFGYFSMSFTASSPA